MKLIPIDKTFQVKEVLLNEGIKKHLYIKTEEDEVVIYVDNKNNLTYISESDLLKDENIENVYFRFRKEKYANGGIYEPLSFILKLYKNGEVKVFDLNKEIAIDDNFKNNIFLNKDKLKTIPDILDYINKNNFIGLFCSSNFSDKLFKKMVSIHIECETMKEKVKSNGLSDKAINYLKYRGLLEKISKLKLTQLEINKFNEIGEDYKKVLKK